jgi:hypothetical protein
MNRVAGWCAFIGWVVIPAISACLVVFLPADSAYCWPLWILDVYLIAAGLVFLAGTATGIRTCRCRRVDRWSWRAIVPAALCLAGLLAVTAAVPLGFHTTVGYEACGGSGIGSLVGSQKIAFAASTPPEVHDDRVVVWMENRAPLRVGSGLFRRPRRR